MKLFYQQLVAFLSAIIITIVLGGWLSYRFFTNQIYDNYSQQLLGYAQTIVSNDMDLTEIEQSFTLLQANGVRFAIFSADNQLIYPQMSGNFVSSLSEEDIAQLKENRAISLRHQPLEFPGSNVQMVNVYYPVFTEGTFNGFIMVGSPVSDLRNEQQAIRNLIILVFSIVLLFGVLFSYLIARYFTKRISTIQKATEEIKTGNYAVRLPTDRKDELGELSDNFNQMTQALEISNQEITRQENLRNQFMMDVAHEMRTPLTTMIGLIEGLEYDMIPPDKRGRSLQLMSSETKRLIRLVNDNLDYEKIRANQITLTKTKINGAELLNDLQMLMSEIAAERQDKIKVTLLNPNEKIYADYDRLKQILVNIIKNAIQFTENGTITLTLNSEDDYSVIGVIDTGIGMSQEVLDNIWERFYKIDASRQNKKYSQSGIGLALVKLLVTAHQGRIEVTSKPEHGTRVTVYLPHAKPVED